MSKRNTSDHNAEGDSVKVVAKCCGGFISTVI
jgi:hypothetical protein